MNVAYSFSFQLFSNTRVKKRAELGTPRIIIQQMTPIPAVLRSVTIIISKIDPSIRSAGFRTNINGIINETNPNRIASNPTFVGFAFAIPAAANEATATGGVIAEIIEK